MKKLLISFTLIFLTTFTFLSAATNPPCIADPNPFSTSRPLLDTLRTIYNDVALQTWKWKVYNQIPAAIQNVPPINGVKLTVKLRPGNEFIDRRKGGIIKANIKKGLNYSLKMAQNTVPSGATVLSTGTPIIKIITFGVDGTGKPRGLGWAWNSIKYKHKNEVYEIVYFYHGYYDINKGGHPYWDGELHLVANKAAKIATTCQKKTFTYQVIRGNPKKMSNR
ncbi:MAG: hypothetical protein HQK83_03660 [Fibrobacteria bacterium]|nr:hypothetical protein [Fibrobacteria bacterium]